MKYKTLFRALVAVGLLSPAVSIAQADFNKSIESVDDLLRLQAQMARSDEKTREELLGQEMKLKGMAEYARSVAIRAGINAGLESVNQQIQDYSRQLDAIYNFQGLMIEQKVIPPVITENNNLFNQTGSQEIRTSGKIYNIYSQARFSSVPLNWRKYLDFPIESSAYEKYSYASTNLYPKTAVEKQVWEEATRKGWEEGVNQAGIMLEQSFDRLNRDYVGMVRYHILALEGKVTLPIVSSYKLYNTNTGTKMIMDENLIRLEVLPTFKSDITTGLGEEWIVPNYLIAKRNEIRRPVPLRQESHNEIELAIKKQVQDQLNNVKQSPSSDYIKLPEVKNANTVENTASLQQQQPSTVIVNEQPISTQPAVQTAPPPVRYNDALDIAYEQGQQQTSSAPISTAIEDSPYLRITRNIRVIGYPQKDAGIQSGE